MLNVDICCQRPKLPSTPLVHNNSTFSSESVTKIIFNINEKQPRGLQGMKATSPHEEHRMNDLICERQNFHPIYRTTVTFLYWCLFFA